MRLAWFRPRRPRRTDDAITADVEAALATRHQVVRYDEVNAHDFVWQHARTPFDLTVHELADTPAHQFIWPYALRDPGILLLRGRTLQESRADTLLRARRLDHLRDERRFATTTLVRSPLAAARVTVVHDAALAEELRALDPGADIRLVPLGIAGTAGEPAAEAPQAFEAARTGQSGPALRAGILRHDRVAVAERAAQRCRAAGTPIDLIQESTGGALLPQVDAVLDMEWPPTGGLPATALRAMAAGLPVVMLETEATAACPALDSQTWQPRGFDVREQPIAITIEARDEEHSLMLALRRLATDGSLRARLGSAARAWISEHANVTAATLAWEAILLDAVARPFRPLPPDWPPHLTADGSDRLTAVVEEMGIDFNFQSPIQN